MRRHNQPHHALVGVPFHRAQEVAWGDSRRQRTAIHERAVLGRQNASAADSPLSPVLRGAVLTWEYVQPFSHDT